MTTNTEDLRREFETSFDGDIYDLTRCTICPDAARAGCVGLAGVAGEQCGLDDVWRRGPALWLAGAWARWRGWPEGGR